MIDRIKETLEGKRVAILGFGLEGQSTFRFLRQHLGDIPLLIADRDEDIERRPGPDLSGPGIRLHTGPGYLDHLAGADILFKSPGIGLPEGFRDRHPGMQVTSQAAMVMEEYHRQVIGITGTKGKSTTSSLIWHILHAAGRDAILIGNIGVPPFDSLHLAGPQTHIVYELSSHQLEDIRRSPRIALLLNLFPEHLDRYASARSYYQAKWNIFLHQDKDGILVLWDEIHGGKLPPDGSLTAGKVLRYGTSESIGQGGYLKEGQVHLRLGDTEEACCRLEEELYLKGRHNRMNILAAILACRMSGLSSTEIMAGVKTFRGLEHRLEHVGCYGGIEFYNDSIATIPEATIEAVQTVQNIGTLLLGGFDRNLDYSALVDFLMDTAIRNFIFMGKAGERMQQMAGKHEKAGEHQLFFAGTMEAAFDIIRRETPAGAACLLSPAAASYDQFKNFEERGRIFKKIARGL